MAAAIPVAISAVGAYSQSQAASSAADAQAKAAKQAAQLQQQQFEQTQAQLAPYREAGTQALEQQQALLGLLGPEAQAKAYQAYTESPGQAFLRQRGEQALLRNAAATGGLGGGNVLSALQQQGIGFAQQDLQNQLARLTSLSEAGRGAAVNTGQFGAQSAANVGNLLGQQAEAKASGILGRQLANQQFLGQVGGIATGALAGGGYFGSTAQNAFGGSASAGSLLGLLE